MFIGTVLVVAFGVSERTTPLSDERVRSVQLQNVSQEKLSVGDLSVFVLDEPGDRTTVQFVPSFQTRDLVRWNETNVFTDEFLQSFTRWGDAQLDDARDLHVFVNGAHHSQFLRQFVQFGFDKVVRRLQTFVFLRGERKSAFSNGRTFVPLVSIVFVIGGRRRLISKGKSDLEIFPSSKTNDCRWR